MTLKYRGSAPLNNIWQIENISVFNDLIAIFRAYRETKPYFSDLGPFFQARSVQNEVGDPPFFHKQIRKD